MIVRPFSDDASFAESAVRGILREQVRAAERGERFSLVLAGGSTPGPVYRLLASQAWSSRIDWETTDVFFGDERAVGPDEEGSNFRMAREALLGHVPIPPSSVHRIRGETGAEAAARDYDALLRGYLGEVGRLSLVLLGLGEDGHTASLFPGSPALRVSDRLAVATKGPPPFEDRVTLTLPALNRADAVHFLVTGSSKAARAAEAIRAMRGAESSDLPAARVRPPRASLVWRLGPGASDALCGEEG